MLVRSRELGEFRECGFHYPAQFNVLRFLVYFSPQPRPVSEPQLIFEMNLFRRAEDSKAPAACSSRLTPGQCGFSGNSDLYGLGIRLGIYLQLLAMTWAMILFQKKGHDQVVTYNVFILSFIIALFVVSFNDECVFEVELIMLQYIIWSGYATIFAWVYLIFGEDGASRKGTGLVISICTYPILAYSFYFWLSIVRDLPARFTPTPCGHLTFYSLG